MADGNLTPCPATKAAFEAAIRDLERIADAQRAIASAASTGNAALLAAQVAAQRRLRWAAPCPYPAYNAPAWRPFSNAFSTQHTAPLHSSTRSTVTRTYRMSPTASTAPIQSPTTSTNAATGRTKATRPRSRPIPFMSGAPASPGRARKTRGSADGQDPEQSKRCRVRANYSGPAPAWPRGGAGGHCTRRTSRLVGRHREKPHDKAQGLRRRGFISRGQRG